MLSKLIALIFMIAVSVGMSVLVSIKGWGLTPKSWGWIIGVGFGVQIFIQIIMRKLMDEE